MNVNNTLLCITSERDARCDALITCSALKWQYRQILLHGVKAVANSSSSSLSSPSDFFFLFLHGDYDLIQQRMESRTGHFMKADMLRSQFDTLQPPSVGEENVLPLNIKWNVSDMVVEVEKHLARVKSELTPKGELASLVNLHHRCNERI